MRTASVAIGAICSGFLSLAPVAAQNVGVSAAVNQSARGLRPGASIRTIVLGDNVVHNERIETDRIGLLQILLADGTTFTVGPNSALSIDRFVYDPAAGTAQVTASLTKGVFRFIGGKTSKTAGGVRLNTPVGTIGIRGAMVDMSFGKTSGAITTHLDLKYGKELTLTDESGSTERVHEAGYSIIVSKGEDGRDRREIRRTPPGLTNEIQQALSGSPGTHGGSRNLPSDQIVVASRIATQNSDRPPAVNAPPIPTARPSNPADVVQTERDVVETASADLTRTGVVDQTAALGDALQTPSNASPDPAPTPAPTVRPDPKEPETPDIVTEGPSTPPVDPDPTSPVTPTEPEPQGPQPPTGTPTTPAVLPYRVVLATAGTTYALADGGVVNDPGDVGLVGGSADEDRIVTLGRADGASTASGATNRGDLKLPVFDDGSFTVRSIPTDGQASLGGIPLEGLVYSGEGGFAAYTLGLGGDATRPVYALAGTPTSDPSVFQRGFVRTYAYYPDLLQGIPVPFMRADALGSDYSSASITDFYVLENNDPDAITGDPTTYQTWLMIKGSGSTQLSGIGVNVGSIETDGSGALSIVTNRRGTFRADPIGFSSGMGGAVATAAGPSGGNQFFGPNAQSFVLAGDSQANDYFADSPSDRGPAELFSTTQVLSLKGEASQADFRSGRETDRFLANRTISGFASGLIEVARADDSYDQVLGTSSASGSPFFIVFDGTNNSLGGAVTIGDAARTFEIETPFGSGTAGNTTNGRSTYIDDDLFAATNNNRRSLNKLTAFDPNPNTLAAATTYEQRQNSNPRTYLVSGDANPQPDVMPDGKLCDCTFLEWGWWGTQLNASDTGDNTQTVRASVHLGTWVAGDLSNEAELDSLDGVTATYTGRVLGNVSVNPGSSGTGIDDYVASGAMSMTYTFGLDTGSMRITDFDDRDFAGVIAGPRSPGDPALSGTLRQQNLNMDAEGTFNGAFVNDGATVAAGVIGDIDLTQSGGGWSAVGIVAGARP